MFNLIPKSLRVSLKLCIVAALLTCSGCMAVANGLMIIGTHDGLNSMNPNQNSGEVIYTQTPYVEPAAKGSFSNQSTAKQP